MWDRLKQINPVFLVLLALIIVIAIISPHFLAPTGYMNFLKRAAPIAILAAGQLFVITSGGFDLSSGALVTLTVIGSSILLNGDPNATWWVISVMLGVGVCVGVINALVVAYLRVPSIIATLGMMITLGGIALTWSGGAPRGYLPDTFRFFGRTLIKDVPLIKILPVSVIVMVVICGLLWWLMHRTNYGKMLHSLGDNPKAAAFAGVPTVPVRMLAFVLSSLSAVIAGILLGGFAGVSTDVGTGLELQAITAAVIGGAQLLGGRGAVGATVAGALVLQAIFTLLNMLGFPKPLRDVVQGLILISAVALATYRRRKSAG
ncbi:ribose transport system permease protein [Cohaesibacter gelatinilyticus]|jgi:ribose transport system permease protein|uniref:Autoinducer 2 import system permease protein LsrD n=2 Tax=Cohaesibacter gelatinilyticus TaxID=372072 RepID=A0A285PES8_9HYPH|nr:ribose transport system permease protein [Cohaesibacter gelatinilyticus]